MTEALIGLAVGSLVTLIGSFLTHRAAMRTEENKVKVAETAHKVDYVKVQMDSWHQVNQDLREEIARLKQEREYDRQDRDADRHDSQESIIARDNMIRILERQVELLEKKGKK
jgi:hypothetical protein